MSLKTILRNVLPNCSCRRGIYSDVDNRFHGRRRGSPMIGSGIGTWLLIRSWDRSRKNGAEQLREHPMAFLMRKWTGSDEKPN